ncbi:MAG: GNAT family protein [Bacteroidota bacterium]
MPIDFDKSYVLENQRVRLEPLMPEHLEELKEIASEEAIWTYFLGRSDGSGDFRHYLEDAITARREHKEYPFAVFDKIQGKYTGCTRFFDCQHDLNTIRLGYTWYGKTSRGTGLNKNCKFLMFQFAFEELGVERVGLGAHAENKISIAAMESVGCTREGKIRNLFPSIKGPERADAVLLGLLKSEWHASVKEKLKHRL